MGPGVGVVGGIRGNVGGPVLPAGLVSGLELWRALIDSNGGGVGYATAAVGVGEARDAVGADAPREPQRLRSHLLHLGGGRPAAAGWEQVLTGSLGRPDLGIAGPELLSGELGLVEHAAAVGVGPVRHPA